MSPRILKLLSMGRMVVLAYSLIFLATIPTELIERGPVVCIFKNLIGIECFGCGITRALSSILHGNLVAAVSYNKLVVIVFLLLCFILLKDIVSIFLLKHKQRMLLETGKLVILERTPSNEWK